MYWIKKFQIKATITRNFIHVQILRKIIIARDKKFYESDIN